LELIKKQTVPKNSLFHRYILRTDKSESFDLAPRFAINRRASQGRQDRFRFGISLVYPPENIVFPKVNVTSYLSKSKINLLKLRDYEEELVGHCSTCSTPLRAGKLTTGRPHPTGFFFICIGLLVKISREDTAKPVLSEVEGMAMSARPRWPCYLGSPCYNIGD